MVSCSIPVLRSWPLIKLLLIMHRFERTSQRNDNRGGHVPTLHINGVLQGFLNSQIRNRHCPDINTELWLLQKAQLQLLVPGFSGSPLHSISQKKVRFATRLCAHTNTRLPGYNKVTVFDYQPYDKNAYDPDKG